MDKFIKRKQSDDNESESKRSKAAKPCDKAPKAQPKRQYCDDYLKYGFHWTGSEDQPFPLCVICGKKMPNEDMVPSKLSRHFVTKHSQLQHKNLNYFQRLLEQQSKQKTAFQILLTVSEKAQAASYDVAKMIAQQTRSHTLAESIILPACRKIVKRILGDKVEQEIRKTPQLNNTIQRRIVVCLLISRKLCRLNFKAPWNSLYKLMNQLTSAANHSYLRLFVSLMEIK